MIRLLKEDRCIYSVARLSDIAWRRDTDEQQKQYVVQSQPAQPAGNILSHSHIPDDFCLHMAEKQIRSGRLDNYSRDIAGNGQWNFQCMGISEKVNKRC